MAITPLPNVPQRGDQPDVFIAKADAFLAALPIFRSEANAVAEAMNLNATSSTSTTSVAIGSGSKTLTAGANKSYVVGMTVKIAATSDGTKWMLGDVTAYTPGTGLLTVAVSAIQGAGTFASWHVTQAAPGGAAPGANTDITSLASPFLADATANTQAVADDSDKVATTAHVKLAIAAAVDSVFGPGSIIAFSGSTPPAGTLALPTAATNLSRTVYGDLHAAMAAAGYPWGAGDGSTTFGMPWLPVDYAMVQGGTVGTATVGQVINHGHGTNGLVPGGGGGSYWGSGISGLLAVSTNSTTGGGPANLAAGHRFKFAVVF